MSEGNIDQDKRNYRILQVSFNVLIILLLSYIFMTNSFLRPVAPWWKESLCVLTIMLPFYLNYFVLYPFLFKRGRQTIYFVLILLSILIASIVEVQIILPDMKNYFRNVTDHRLLEAYLTSLYVVILFRDLVMIAPWVLYKVYGSEDKFIKKRIKNLEILNY